MRSVCTDQTTPSHDVRETRDENARYSLPDFVMAANPVTRSALLPDEWNDPKRAKFLMSEFRSRAANPEGYDAKLAFWTRHITAWSSASSVPCFSIADVRQSFARDGVQPDVACIKRVLSHMLITDQIRPRRQVEQMLSQRVGWSRWSVVSRGLGLVTKPLSWGWSYLTSSHGSETEPVDDHILSEELFVHMSSLSETADRLFREVTRSEKQILRFSELTETGTGTRLSQSDMELLVQHLQSEGKACVIEDCGTRLVKFGDEASFSQMELGLYRLESAKELIEKDIRQIESEMSSLKEEARQALRNNNRSQATQMLRRKKRLEHLLVNKESQVDNIIVLLQQMSDSDSNALILQCFQQAADVLKKIQSAGNPVGDLDATMLEVEDAVQAATSLQTDLSRSIDPFTDLDSGLDQELAEILQDSVSEKDEDPEKAEKTDDMDALMVRLERLRSPEKESKRTEVARRAKAAVAGHT